MKKIILPAFFSVSIFFITSFALAEKAALLVSLGMPTEVLKAYLKQGKDNGIPLVIRGLYTEKKNQREDSDIGSFKDTVNRLKEVMGEEHLGGISIDPTLFRSFAVQVVPALVLYDEKERCLEKSRDRINEPCDSDSFDLVLGNLPVKKQLMRIVEASKSYKRVSFAQSILLAYENRENHSGTGFGIRDE